VSREIDPDELQSKAPDEEDGPKITPSEEMEAALREASSAVDDRRRDAGDGGGDGEGAGSADKLTIEMLSNELQSLKEAFEARGKELDEAVDRHLRLSAEFENFRRRGLKERQEFLQFGHQNLVKDLLTTVDNLERTAEHAEENAGGDLQSLLQGIELVRRELLGQFGKHAVKVIEAEGEDFDPQYHEAMGQVPSLTAKPGTVIQVLQKGYLLHDRMLRPARVIVAREPTDDEKREMTS
jgi:molecular chaperone GrpE